MVAFKKNVAVTKWYLHSYPVCSDSAPTSKGHAPRSRSTGELRATYSSARSCSEIITGSGSLAQQHTPCFAPVGAAPNRWGEDPSPTLPSAMWNRRGAAGAGRTTPAWALPYTRCASVALVMRGDPEAGTTAGRGLPYAASIRVVCW